MEMKRYEPKVKTKIRAIQYTQEMHDGIIALYGETDYDDLTPHWWPKDAVIFPFLNLKKQLMIPSCEDCLIDFQVNIGDWIVLQNSDSVSVLSDEAFQAYYKPVK